MTHEKKTTKRNLGEEEKKKKRIRIQVKIITLLVSTSSITSSIVASSPIPYRVIAFRSSSLVINLVKFTPVHRKMS